MARRRSSGDNPWDDYDRDYFPPSKPIPTTEGIKAKSSRGEFGGSWWGKRWIAVLESFGWGNRLQRGRSYARSGQVLDLEVKTGQVKAKVQGSRPTPYKVTMTVTPLTDQQWELVEDALAEQAIFAAQLLAGEMPRDIDVAFAAAGVPLFPQSSRDLKTECSCPDYANPCKHIAAAHYILGETFDEDPFLIFQLRGRSQAQIMEALRTRRAAAVEDEPEPAVAVEHAPALVELLDHFYQASAELAEVSIQVAGPEVEAGLLKQLGDAPVGTDADLRAVYQAMTQHALRKVLGEA